MKKSKKRKLRNPPLSFLDRCIYAGALLLIIILAFSAVLIFDRIEYFIAKSFSLTIAYRPNATFLFVLPCFFYIFISLLVFTIYNWESRKPIFGDRKIAYGTAPWNKDCFPFFSPERKKRYVKPTQRRFHRNCMIAWCAGLVIPVLLFPLGLFGRTCLLQNTNIVEYNVFNNITAEYTADDFDALILKTNHVIPYKGAPYWEYVMIIETEGGKRISFSNGDFIMDTNQKKLEKMAEIKGYFPSDRITIIGENNLEKVADSLGLCDTETNLLFNLFSMN